MLVETKRSVGKKYFYTQTDENLNFLGHIHNSYEFITVTDGKLDCIVYDKRYTLEPGKAMLIMPNHVHRYETPKSSKSFLCIFSPDYVAEFHNDTAALGYVCSLFNYSDGEGVDLLREDKSNIYIKKGILYGICGHAYGALSRDLAGGGEMYAIEVRLIEYIRSNYDSGITLRQMALDLGYNYSYLSDMFNKVFGCGFSKFVNRLKVDDAAELLKTGNLSIAQISVYCGFNNIRTLNARFKEIYGVTPSEYRKNARNEK